MPSNAVFVDTSGWIAILNKDDALHDQASAFMQQFGEENRSLVTSDWIFAETGNGLARTPARLQFPKTVRLFLQSPFGRFIRIDGELFQKALELYAQAKDKTWGLVDCASFVI